MEQLDCRGRTAGQCGRAIIDHFNVSESGARFEAHLDAYDTVLRIWLLEAGVRHGMTRADDGSYRLTIVRGLSPAQGTMTSVHHVVAADDGMIWTGERGHQVARIDGHEKRIVTTASVATHAGHLALDAAARLLFIADPGSNRVIAARASDLSIEHTWEAPGRPQLPLASPDGVVCVTGGSSGTLTIARPRRDGYDVQTIAIGEHPHDPVFDRSGDHVFVPCVGSGEVVKVRLADGQVVGRCSVGDGPSHMVTHPDGSRVYSANCWDGTVSCVSADGELVAQAGSGAWAHAVDITPDGRWIYVANFLDDTLAVFDSQTLDRLAVLPTEPYPHGLDISPDGRYVIATGFSSDHVRLYDAQKHCEIARIEVGRGSSHTAFIRDADAAFVACSVSDHVTCIDLAERSGEIRLRLDAQS